MKTYRDFLLREERRGNINALGLPKKAEEITANSMVLFFLSFRSTQYQQWDDTEIYLSKLINLAEDGDQDNASGCLAFYRGLLDDRQRQKIKRRINNEILKKVIDLSEEHKKQYGW